ncbi:MAG: PIN/TRAM domain-containing protein [Planctomycetota bacterium]
MVLFILRGAFLVLVAAVISLFVGSEFQRQGRFGFGTVAAIIGLTVALATLVIVLDVSSKHKRLSSISGVFLGLVAGLVAAYALSFVVDLIGVYIAPDDVSDEQGIARAEALNNLLRGVKVVIGLVTCYVAISLVIQTKDDFRFVIPYVEFAKEIRGNRPTLLDTSVIIDGRILEIIETRVLQGTLVVPKFVLDELQLIADSADGIKRSRGRRGLDILQKLQASTLVEVHIEEKDAEGSNVDQKLITLGQAMRARVMTNDFNLNKIATLRGVDVINLNDLAKALRPVVLPGEHMNVKLVKPGEAGTQGVGYLDDGTMVVVEGGRTHLGHHVDLVVTSTLQTSAGRMIFGRFAREDDAVPATSADPRPANRGTPSSGNATSDKPGPASQTDSESEDQAPTPPAKTNDPLKSRPSNPPERTGSSSHRNPRRG